MDGQNQMKILHGGKIGDIIYSIPALRALSKARNQKITYVLHQGREWGEKAAEAIAPLLWQQDFVESVEIDFSGEKTYYDNDKKDAWKTWRSDVHICMDQFRWEPGIAPHLAIGQALYLGVAPDWSEPWIQIGNTERNPNRIVLHAHREYHNGKSIQAPEKFRDISIESSLDVTIIGTESDIHDMDDVFTCGIDYYCPTDMLDAARYIYQNAHVFIGGDHSPLGLAVGMWIPTIAEVFSPLENTAPSIIPSYLWRNMQLSHTNELLDFIAQHSELE